MVKVLDCGHVFPGCPARIAGATEQEVMAQEAEHAMREHGLPGLSPELQKRLLARIHDHRPESPGSRPYAHVNIWHLTAADDPHDQAAASAVAHQLRGQPGFRSYVAVRTGAHEVVAVTVFDSEEELRAAMAATGDLVKERVAPLAASAPERRQGAVLAHAAA